jgi:hypothetical protein
MNQRIKELAEQAGIAMIPNSHPISITGLTTDLEKFAELLKQAIYDQVKEELIPDELISVEPDSVTREFFKGCNGGIVDALCHIQNFGVDIDE